MPARLEGGLRTALRVLVPLLSHPCRRVGWRRTQECLRMWPWTSPRGVGVFESFPKECPQRNDAGDLALLGNIVHSSTFPGPGLPGTADMGAVLGAVGFGVASLAPPPRCREPPSGNNPRGRQTCACVQGQAHLGENRQVHTLRQGVFIWLLLLLECSPDSGAVATAPGPTLSEEPSPGGHVSPAVTRPPVS